MFVNIRHFGKNGNAQYRLADDHIDLQPRISRVDGDGVPIITTDMELDIPFGVIGIVSTVGNDRISVKNVVVRGRIPPDHFQFEGATTGKTSLHITRGHQMARALHLSTLVIRVQFVPFATIEGSFYALLIVYD